MAKSPASAPGRITEKTGARRRAPGRRVSVSAIAAGLLLASSCSGGSGSDSAGTATGCHSPGVTPDTVRIGLVIPDTGAFAPVFTPARSALNARIAQQNAAGGVNGRKIVLDWRDDASDPTQNGAAAQYLVERAGDLALLETTAAAPGSEDYLDRAGIPVVGIATDFTWAAHRNMVSHTYVHSEHNSVDTFGQYVRQAGGSRAFLVEDFADSTSALSRTITKSVQSQGVAVVDRATFSATGDIADRVAERIRASGADVLLGGLPGPSFAPIVAAVNRLGIRMKAMLAISGYDQSLLQQYGDGLDGLSVYIPYTPFEMQTPALKRYDDAVAAYAPEMTTPNKEAGIQAYIAADLLVRGLQAAGTCPTRASLLSGLRGIHDFVADGLLPGPVDLSRNFQTLTQCYYFVRVEGSPPRFVPQRRPGAPDDIWCGASV